MGDMGDMYSRAVHISLLFYIFSATTVLSQDVYSTKLEVSPSGLVEPGTVVNLTCAFKITRAGLHSVQFQENGQLFFRYPESFSGEFPRALSHGTALSDDVESVYSKVWVTTKSSFCHDTSLQLEYKCIPQDDQRRYSAGAASDTTYAGPSQVLSMDGTEICGDRNDEHTLNHDQIGKKKQLKLTAKNQRKNVTVLEFKIGGDTFDSFSKQNQEDICIYGGEVMGEYTFPNSGDYQLEYTVQTSGNPETKKTCTIKVKEAPDTTMTTTTTVKSEMTSTSFPHPTIGPNDTDDEKMDEDNTGKIVGGIFGALIASGLIVLLVIFILKKLGKGKSLKAGANETDANQDDELAPIRKV